MYNHPILEGIELILLQHLHLQRLPSFTSVCTLSCDAMFTNASQMRFELFPFRSPLLREWIRFSFQRDVRADLRQPLCNVKT